MTSTRAAFAYRMAVVLLLMLMTGAPFAASAQRRSMTTVKPVLFVCEHGTVRSLLAKVLFEEYAAEVGLKIPALSRGTQADSVVPPWMLQGLASDHVTLGAWRPQSLREVDLQNAAFVVSFDLPAAATAGARAPQARWDSLPSVSRDYATGRDAIKTRVHRLVDSLKQAHRKR